MQKKQSNGQDNNNSGLNINHNRQNNGSDVAIIGMACRFPGAPNYQIFWDNLRQGIDSIREIDRWNFEELYSPNEDGKSVSKWMGLLEDVDKFDNNFFNISPREAIHMDPQQRLLLEESLHCIEDSGVSLNRLQEKRTAVYVGAFAFDPYARINSGTEVDIYFGPGIYQFMLANRVSYFFNFNGESKVIETACCSAMVALCDAKKSLAAGEADYVLVAGVSLQFSPLKYLTWSKNRMLSAEGKCKTFDKDANGFVSGEGVGVLLLQPLDQALRDQNHIYGIIKGCAVNHGGKAISISSPRVEAQRDVILAAYEDAGFTPDTVTYIEAHGTGTSLGDPIEIEALNQVFRQYTTKKHFCKIGSVKTNIGHLDAAAGMPSIIKVLLMMRHQEIPATLNVQSINPIIDFDNSPFTIASGLSQWTSRKKGSPLRAGVSSFGYGGVNSHVLLEQFSERASNTESVPEKWYPFILSAKNPNSLEGILNNWRTNIEKEGFMQHNLRDICLTLLFGREAYAYRSGKLIKNKEELVEFLSYSKPDCLRRIKEESWCLRLGGHLWNSYAEWKAVSKEFPIFQTKLELALECLAELDSQSQIRNGLFRESWPEPLVPLYSFILTYACISTLLELGLSLRMVTGYKNGIWASLAICRAMDIKEILAVLSGKMELERVKFNRPEIPFYDPVNARVVMPFIIDDCYLMNLISELSISDSVLTFYLDKSRSLYKCQHTFKKYMEEWDPYLKPIGISVQKMLYEEDFHYEDNDKSDRRKLLLMTIMLSSLHRLNQKWNLSEQKRVTDPRFYELLDLLLDEIMPKEAIISLLTQDNPDFMATAAKLNSRVEQTNIANKKSYKFLLEHSRKIFEISDIKSWFTEVIAIGNPPVLTDMAFIDFGNQLVEASTIEQIVLNPEKGFSSALQENLVKLWLRGLDIEWQKLYPEDSYQKIPLPVYVFERSSFWLPKTEDKAGVEFDSSSKGAYIHPLLHRNTSQFFEQRFSSEFSGRESFFVNHSAKNQRILPEIACLEMARAAVEQAAGTLKEGKNSIELKNIVWGPAITVGVVPIQVHISLFLEENDEIVFEIYSESGDENKEPIVYCQGRATLNSILEIPKVDLQNLPAVPSPNTLSPAKCYESFQKFGIEYRPEQKGIKYLSWNSDFLVAQLFLPATSEASFILSPVMMDSALIAAMGLTENLNPSQLFELDQIQIFGSPTPEMRALIRCGDGNKHEDGIQVFDIDFYNSHGAICVRMKGLKMRPLKKAIPEGGPALRKKCFLKKHWETCLATPIDKPYNRIVILSNPETQRLASLVLQLFSDGINLDINDFRFQHPQPKIDWSNYDGCIDLTGCGTDVTQSLDWIAWLQGMIEANHKEGLMLLHVTKGLESFQNTKINLAGAYRAGLYRMLQSEYSHMRSRHMDVEPSLDETVIAQQIAFEFLMDSEEPEVCYRKGIRYRACLQEAPHQNSKKFPSVFPKDNLLLITGGTRGLGYICAQHFVTNYGVKKLVLIGREVIPPREQWESILEQNTPLAKKIQSIRSLENQGVQVQVLSVLLTDQHEIERSLQVIKNQMGPIGGVIHCAGLVNWKNLAFIQKNVNEIRRILEPKVTGLNTLYHILKNEPLQFFVLFSSVSAIIPSLAAGYSDYAMANAYMDYFAEAYVHECPIISIQWPNWKDTGMGEIKSRVYQQTGLLSHTNAEGLELLDYILAGKIGPVVLPAVVNPDLLTPHQLLRRKIHGVTPTGGNELPINPVTFKHSQTLIDQTHNWLISLFAEELKLDNSHLGIDTPFQEFGVDSIFLAQVIRRMDQELGGIAIEPSALLEFPTIKSLVGYMIGAYPEALTTLFSNQESSASDTYLKRFITPQISENAEALTQGTYNWLVSLFAKELKLDHSNLGIDTPFQEYGIDSIFLAQVIQRMDRELGCVSIEPSALLEFPTIRSLAGYMIQTYPDSIASLLSISVDTKETPKREGSQPQKGLPPLRWNRLKRLPGNKTSLEQEKVAVVGMACHFPNAANIEEYWNNLKSGKDSIREIPKSRWDWAKYYSPHEFKEGKSISKWGGFLEKIQEFDPGYFKISEQLAPQIDPLQRQWLEVSAEALADAGYDKADLWGKQVGVFVGTRIGNFDRKLKQRKSDTIIGTGQNFIAVHLAHIYNFKGPNMVVDTACSSSLTAIHLAVSSIQNGESELALAGGVDILDESVYLTLSASKILSPDGRCKTFDASANGIGVGEGCGVLVLKPLKKAIQDHDKIYGVIDGTAINNDGNTMGVTTPNPDAQRELIEKAIANAKIFPETISYVETHGTGTLIGDPIELKGLTKIFARHTSRKGFCGVGSVKSNIGHLLSAAGVASIIKVLLAIIHQELPPTINCSNPNPRFNFDDSPLYLVRSLKRWEPENNVLRAGVSGFGLGGNNAHIILSNEGIPETHRATMEPKGARVVFNRKRYWPEEVSQNNMVQNEILSEDTSGSFEEEFMEFLKPVKI
ncbi:MAG: KR domain-containing protein [Firmicutes bacterium]|nr:KR domain-containing protein [Bacillota bacterium]